MAILGQIIGGCRMEAVEPKPQQQSFKEVWLITFGHSLTHWYPATFYLLLPIIGKELGLSYSQIGLIISFQFFSSMVSNLPSGMVVDLIGRKNLLMAISLFWVGFPYFLMSFTHSYWMLLLCVALVGIGNNLWHPTAIPTLSQRFPTRKGFVLSIHGMGANLGDALAPLAIGVLLTYLSWREVVVINVIPGLLISGLLMYFLRNLYIQAKHKVDLSAEAEVNKTTGIKNYWKGLRLLVRNRNLLVISISSGFRSMTQSALLTFLPIYLVFELKFSDWWLGFSLFALQFSGLIAAPLGGYFSDKIGRKKIVMSSMAMTAVVLIIMASSGESKMFVFFISLLGFFLFAIRPVMQAWLMDTTPKNMAGTTIGVLFGVQSLFSSISPLMAGIIADKYGLFATFYFVAATIIVSNLLIFLMPSDQSKEIAKNNIL
jgi:FSR family fosmidomycin resistance protein-like MFS transporter